jgi:tetratricopeptide (TPR) repeat protein
VAAQKKPANTSPAVFPFDSDFSTFSPFLSSPAMRPTFPHRYSPITLTIILAITVGTIGFAFGPPAAKAQDVVSIQLKDGRFLEAIISSIEADEVEWRSPSGAPTQPIPYERIDMIHFSATPEWSQAMELFENGEIEKAVEIFKPISVDVTKRTYYPAPGNFATLAQRRLLDCYRALSLPTDIAYIQESMQWDKLPKHERNLASIIDLWAAVGNGKWEEGIEAAETARKAYRTTDPEVNEIGFLLGRIYKKLKDPEKALIYFGEGYGLVTSNPRLAATSMIEAAGILTKIVPDFPERESELKATLHLYAEMIGKGELWEGAEPVLVALFKRKEGTPEVKPPPGDAAPPAKKADK